MGRTHGNEFTGAYLIKKFDKFPELITRASFKTLVLLANPQAFQAVKRYIDKDLNRCFATKDLQNVRLSAYEETGAKISYEEETTVWPVFINEVAYYEKGIAMCLTKKERVVV